MAIPQAELDALDAAQKKTVVAFKDKDYDKFLETFVEDCTFVPNGSAPVKGRAGVKALVEGLHKMGVVDLLVTIEDISPMGECIFKRGDLTLLDKDGKKIDLLNYCQIWRKDDGEYRHVFEMLNSKTPPQPPSS
ncbi:uncharacterized protein [Dysidea avara]|uniref:uncharacterized protein n=1 Tax=Dysidea avara TaxID=196820 RepID=UPI00332991B4